ncbi:MAG: aldo/keto reductase [Candidatus Rokubacteria bacterium]|nr:aldo/keto reductase [Candidatus Rokubacteria bacterium]
MIPGYATPEGTAAYRQRATRAVADHFRLLEDCALSSVGIGTYLGPEDDATDRLYREAAIRALELGANVIDTAVNYRHQRSERAIGEALAELIGSGRLKREEVVVATKGGFIPFDGAPPSNVRDYFTETYLRPGILRPDDVVAGCHAMTPPYLEDQLERSRRNLGLETLDIYYLHNPETQLGEVGRSEFLARLRAAFAFLESAVENGRIRRYGTATWNGCRQPSRATDYLSLAELVEAARAVAGPGHHFRVIQLPYNLAMTEAFTFANQAVDGATVSALEAARRLGIYVMASASVYQGQLTRNLPAVIGDFLPGLATDAQRALQFVRSTPGIGSALVGMKQVAHVEENLEVAKVAPIPWSEFQRLFKEA